MFCVWQQLYPFIYYYFRAIPRVNLHLLRLHLFDYRERSNLLVAILFSQLQGRSVRPSDHRYHVPNTVSPARKSSGWSLASSYQMKRTPVRWPSMSENYPEFHPHGFASLVNAFSRPLTRMDKSSPQDSPIFLRIRDTSSILQLKWSQ